MATYVKDTRTGFQTKLPDTAGDIAAAITAHEAASNPHPTYLTQAEGDAAYSALGHNHDADYANIAHTHGLNDLTDVTVSTPATDEVLKYNGTAWVNAAAPTATSSADTITINMHNSGSVLSTGLAKSMYVVPRALTITGWRLVGYPSGSISLTVIKAANAIPTSSDDSIVANDHPTYTSARIASGSALTGWTTSLAAGDVLGLVIDSVSSVTHCTLILEVE